MLRMLFFGLALALGLCSQTSAQTAGNVSDAAFDFSATQNPNGHWSYGWTQQLGSTFQLATERRVQDGLDMWVGSVVAPSPPGRFPLIGHNGTSNTIVSVGTVRVAPGQLFLHPGPNDEYAVLRFTADRQSEYILSVLFAGIDFVGPTTTDVHVLVDGRSVFDGVVNSFVRQPEFRSFLTLSRGSTVDFAVGFGNGNFFFDSTSVAAVITIAEPEVAALLLPGLSLLMLRRPTRHRRR